MDLEKILVIYDSFKRLEIFLLGVYYLINLLSVQLQPRIYLLLRQYSFYIVDDFVR